jgi:hypothetical protein
MSTTLRNIIRESITRQLNESTKNLDKFGKDVEKALHKATRNIYDITVNSFRDKLEFDLVDKKNSDEGIYIWVDFKNGSAVKVKVEDNPSSELEPNSRFGGEEKINIDITDKSAAMGLANSIKTLF